MIILARNVNQNVNSTIGSSRKRPRVFIQIGLKFPFDRGVFLIIMFILLSLAIFGPHGRGPIVEKKK